MKGRRLIRHNVRQIEVEDFETGTVPDDGLLVQNEYTAISVGTEIWNWVHGAEPRTQSEFPKITGYCNVGRVLEVGKDIADVKPGDRVAGQGTGLVDGSIGSDACHDLGAAAKRRGWHAAADNLAESCQIRLDAEECLCTTFRAPRGASC